MAATNERKSSNIFSLLILSIYCFNVLMMFIETSEALPITSKPIENTAEKLAWEAWLTLPTEQKNLEKSRKVTPKSIFTLPFRDCPLGYKLLELPCRNDCLPGQRVQVQCVTTCPNGYKDQSSRCLLDCPPGHTVVDLKCLPIFSVDQNKLLVQELYLLAGSGNAENSYDYEDEEIIMFDPPKEVNNDFVFNKDYSYESETQLPSKDEPLKFNIFEQKFPTDYSEDVMEPFNKEENQTLSVMGDEKKNETEEMLMKITNSSSLKEPFSMDSIDAIALPAVLTTFSPSDSQRISLFKNENQMQLVSLNSSEWSNDSKNDLSNLFLMDYLLPVNNKTMEDTLSKVSEEKEASADSVTPLVKAVESEDSFTLQPSTVQDLDKEKPLQMKAKNDHTRSIEKKFQPMNLETTTSSHLDEVVSLELKHNENYSTEDEMHLGTLKSKVEPVENSLKYSTTQSSSSLSPSSSAESQFPTPLPSDFKIYDVDDESKATTDRFAGEETFLENENSKEGGSKPDVQAENDSGTTSLSSDITSTSATKLEANSFDIQKELSFINALVKSKDKVSKPPSSLDEKEEEIKGNPSPSLETLSETNKLKSFSSPSWETSSEKSLMSTKEEEASSPSSSTKTYSEKSLMRSKEEAPSYPSFSVETSSEMSLVKSEKEAASSPNSDFATLSEMRLMRTKEEAPSYPSFTVETSSEMSLTDTNEEASSSPSSSTKTSSEMGLMKAKNQVKGSPSASFKSSSANSLKNAKEEASDAPDLPLEPSSEISLKKTKDMKKSSSIPLGETSSEMIPSTQSSDFAVSSGLSLMKTEEKVYSTPSSDFEASLGINSMKTTEEASSSPSFDMETSSTLSSMKTKEDDALAPGFPLLNSLMKTKDDSLIPLEPSSELLTEETKRSPSFIQTPKDDPSEEETLSLWEKFKASEAFLSTSMPKDSSSPTPSSVEENSPSSSSNRSNRNSKITRTSVFDETSSTTEKLEPESSSVGGERNEEPPEDNSFDPFWWIPIGWHLDEKASLQETSPNQENEEEPLLFRLWANFSRAANINGSSSSSTSSSSSSTSPSQSIHPDNSS